MIELEPWRARPPEVRNLLNPAFCALLLFESIAEHGKSSPMDFELAFLVLPLVLDEMLRGTLPKAVSTPFALWISRNPAVVATLSERARNLAPFTKEALLWATSRKYVKLNANGQLEALVSAFRADRLPKDPFGEIGDMAIRARFLGRWFASSGRKEVIFMLLGLRP